MKRISWLITVILICLIVTGCSENHSVNHVTATTLPVYEITSHLCAGTDITVDRLIRENVSCLHDYTLQVSQMQMLENAAAVVISGAGFEDFLDDAIPTDKTVIDASINISCLSGAEHGEHEHSHPHDPHIWLAPKNAMVMSNNILNGLIDLFPQHAHTFRENHKMWLHKLEELSSFAQEQIQNLTTNRIITFHDGFGYLAQAFNLEILHSMEEESGSEASAAELIEVINLIKEHDIHVLFTEKNGSDSAAKIIAAETGAKIYQLNMAMSGDSYLEAMYHNIRTLKEALG